METSADFFFMILKRMFKPNVSRSKKMLKFEGVQ